MNFDKYKNFFVKPLIFRLCAFCHLAYLQAKVKTTTLQNSYRFLQINDGKIPLSGLMICDLCVVNGTTNPYATFYLYPIDVLKAYQIPDLFIIKIDENNPGYALCYLCHQDIIKRNFENVFKRINENWYEESRYKVIFDGKQYDIPINICNRFDEEKGIAYCKTYGIFLINKEKKCICGGEYA
ncbi:MAG: hypothetical protein QXI58_01845 [Candidatus Micrarchaeia archaeon]